MERAESDLSALCTTGDHAECPHWNGGEVRLFGKKANRSRDVLCGCICHAACPATATSKDGLAPEGVWREICTCPGSARLREATGGTQPDAPPPPPPSGAARLGLLVRGSLGLRKAFKNQDLSEDSPRFVMLDDRSDVVLQRALELAADDRDDDAAVSELRRMAGRPRTLERAAAGARQSGEHHDYPVHNLAHRLLQAAITGGSVAAVEPRDAERIAVLLPFVELDLHEQWSRLVTEVQGLRDLEVEVDQRSDPDPLDRRREIYDRARRLVGPSSGSADILVSSHAALEAAIAHLTHMA